MKKTLQFYFLLCISPLISVSLYAQSPSDATLMKAKQACILVEYNYSSFNEYWEGDVRRKNNTIQTVKRHTVMPMVAVGIFDRLNFYAGVPFIKTFSIEPNGGKFNGVSGFQDLRLALKYKWLEKELGQGNLTGLATVGFSTPITNYLPDYMPYSLGLGAPELSYRAIFQYDFKKEWYLRGAGAYLWRGYAEAEREYYYNNGSYYTQWMDVPNAITVEAVIGKWFLNKSLQLEISYFGSKSLSGDDIRLYNAPQPTNNIDFDRLGLFAHYYFSKIKGLGVVAYHNRNINGRNAAQLNTTGFGITYFFNYLKNNNNEK
jgi:hypothetical protein